MPLINNINEIYVMFSVFQCISLFQLHLNQLPLLNPRGTGKFGDNLVNKSRILKVFRWADICIFPYPPHIPSVIRVEFVSKLTLSSIYNRKSFTWWILQIFTCFLCIVTCHSFCALHQQIHLPSFHGVLLTKTWWLPLRKGKVCLSLWKQYFIKYDQLLSERIMKN